MIPAVVAVLFTGLSGIFIYLYVEGFRPVENPHDFCSNLYFFALHFCMASALALSVFAFAYSSCMALIGLIFRAWAGALLAIGLAIFSFLLAEYLLNTMI